MKIKLDGKSAKTSNGITFRKKLGEHDYSFAF